MTQSSRTKGLNIAKETIGPGGAEDRAYLVGVMTRVSGPVLEALSENKLKEKFPVRDWDKHRRDCTYTEAFARTLAGVAPWIELGPDSTPEGKLREKFGLMARRSLINATDPKSPDYLSFGLFLNGRPASPYWWKPLTWPRPFSELPRCSGSL